MFTDNVPEDAQIVAFCKRLERERNAARDERDALSEALERNCVQYVQKQQSIIAERDALRADVVRLREALDEYGEHQGVCPKKYHSMKDSRPCTCGLDEALTTPAQ